MKYLLLISSLLKKLAIGWLWAISIFFESLFVCNVGSCQKHWFTINHEGQTKGPGPKLVMMKKLLLWTRVEKHGPNIHISGQMIIFHQPRFPRGFCFQNATSSNLKKNSQKTSNLPTCFKAILGPDSLSLGILGEHPDISYIWPNYNISPPQISLK